MSQFNRKRKRPPQAGIEKIQAIREADTGTVKLKYYDKVMAVLAKGAYSPSVSEKRALLQSFKLSEWSVDESLTNDRRTVYVNQSQNVVTTSFRGTRPSDLTDLSEDLLIVLGVQDKSIRSAAEKLGYAQVLAKYPSAKHALSSHSLGGAMNHTVFSQYMNNITRVYNFSPGSGLGEVARLVSTYPPEQARKIYNFRVTGDPVAAAMYLDPNSRNVTLNSPRAGGSGPLAAHTIDNFILK